MAVTRILCSTWRNRDARITRTYCLAVCERVGGMYCSKLVVRDHNGLKSGKKSPFWQDNTLFASKAKINIF